MRVRAYQSGATVAPSTTGAASPGTPVSLQPILPKFDIAEYQDAQHGVYMTYSMSRQSWYQDSPYSSGTSHLWIHKENDPNRIQRHEGQWQIIFTQISLQVPVIQNSCFKTQNQPSAFTTRDLTYPSSVLSLFYSSSHTALVALNHCLMAIP